MHDERPRKQADHQYKLLTPSGGHLRPLPLTSYNQLLGTYRNPLCSLDLQDGINAEDPHLSLEGQQGGDVV